MSTTASSPFRAGNKFAMRRGIAGTQSAASLPDHLDDSEGFVMSSSTLKDVDGSELTVPKGMMATFTDDERESATATPVAPVAPVVPVDQTADQTEEALNRDARDALDVFNDLGLGGGMDAMLGMGDDDLTSVPAAALVAAVPAPAPAKSDQDPSGPFADMSVDMEAVARVAAAEVSQGMQSGAGPAPATPEVHATPALPAGFSNPFRKSTPVGASGGAVDIPPHEASLDVDEDDDAEYAANTIEPPVAQQSQQEDVEQAFRSPFATRGASQQAAAAPASQVPVQISTQKPVPAAPPQGAPLNTSPNTAQLLFQGTRRPRNTRGLDVRQAISSAKTLAPLAMAVSQTAGLESTPELRSQLLGQLLAQTYKATIDVAEGISDVAGRDVQSWMVAQLMQTLAQEISNHWIRDGKTDVNRYSQDFVSLFRDNRALLGSAMELMSNTAYQEVRSDRTVAEDRFAVSTMNAAWSLRGHVHDKRLLVDSAQYPGRYFSFGQQRDALVSRMLESCLNEVAALRLDTADRDMRVAHMQSALTRLTEFVGNQYASQAVQTLNWIRAADTDEERKAREDESVKHFDDRVYPRILEEGRVNFLNVERAALGVLEKADMKERLFPDRPRTSG